MLPDEGVLLTQPGLGETGPPGGGRIHSDGPGRDWAGAVVTLGRLEEAGAWSS